MEANHAKLRTSFVTHEGKKELTVHSKDPLETVLWSEIISSMSKLIEDNTVGDTRTWFECDFSTTNETDKLVS